MHLIMQFSVAEYGETPEPPSIPYRERGVRGLLKHTGPPPQQLYDHVVEKLKQKIGGGKKFKCHLPLGSLHVICRRGELLGMDPYTVMLGKNSVDI